MIWLLIGMVVVCFVAALVAILLIQYIHVIQRHHAETLDSHNKSLSALTDMVDRLNSESSMRKAKAYFDNAANDRGTSC